MKKKKILFFIGGAIGILGLIFTPLSQRLFLSILILNELFHFERPGWLWKLSASPKIIEITYQGFKQSIKADLFLPQPIKKRPGILLNHGVIDTGKDDPRLRRLAEILCRAGFVILIPDFPGMRTFRISPADIEEVRVAFENFIRLESYINKDACGLFGFSYGAGPTIIAACRPAIRDKVRFVVSFGGYYDLKNVLSYIGTGYFEYENKRFFRPPQEYGKWVFLANNLDLINSAADKSVLEEILRVKLKDEKAPITHFLSRLGREGRDILELLSHSDPEQTESLIKKLPPSIQASLNALSVRSALPGLKAGIILAHGEDDDLIPFTETLRLARAVPDPQKAYCQIIRTFTHVDPEHYPLNIKNIFTFYIPEAWKMFGLVNQLMKFKE